jgi:hypothetical protein
MATSEHSHEQAVPLERISELLRQTDRARVITYRRELDAQADELQNEDASEIAGIARAMITAHGRNAVAICIKVGSANAATGGEAAALLWASVADIVRRLQTSAPTGTGAGARSAMRKR